MGKITPETALKRQINQFLDYLGIFHFHVLQGMGSYKGISDIIAVTPEYTYFIEVKSPKGKQSEYQKQFQAKVEKVGQKYILAYSLKDLEFLDKRVKIF